MKIKMVCGGGNINKHKREAKRMGLNLRLMLQDESRFGRITDTHKCWAVKKVRPIIKRQMIREYTYAYGVVSPKDGISDYLILPSMNIDCMNIFLEEVSNRHKEEYILMICDGAPCHSLKGLKIPDNIALEFLPPYSPELNPIENMWKVIKQRYFGNLAFKNMSALEDYLSDVLKYMENDTKTVKSVCGYEWLISEL